MTKIKITTACGVFFKDTLLMIKERQDNREVIDIPAGGLDENESVYEGVKREVLEETGVSIQNPILVAVFQVIKTEQTTINFLFKEILNELPTLRVNKSVPDEEISDVLFVSSDEIKRLMSSNPEIFEHALALKRLDILLNNTTQTTPEVTVINELNKVGY